MAKEAAMSTATLEPPVKAETVGSNRWYLSSAPIVRALVHLCAPMAAAMIVSAVYNVINAGFIGSLHNTALLAAITFGTPLLGLVMAVGGVFGVGGGALISRLLGASENEPATAGAGRGRRATGDDRPDRLHDREPGVRRVVHPGAGSRSPPAC
jgi:hypothetical protein